MTKTTYPHTDVAAFLTWELPTEGQDMWEWQDGRCAMCGQDRRYGNTLCLDHCHATGMTRGYLCRTCNFNEGKETHPAWLWWHAGRHPARLLDQEKVWVNPAGFVPRRDRFNNRYVAAGYVVAIQIYGETIGRELSRPFTWMDELDRKTSDMVIAALERPYTGNRTPTP